MLLGIDHVVIGVPDLDEAARALEATLGLVAAGGGRHPTLGTANRIVWLGDTYLELVSVVDPKVATRSWLGKPVIEALQGGSGFATWAIGSDSLDDDLAALALRGSDLRGPIPGERVRPDGAAVRWRLGLPSHLGPADPPFLIEHDPASAEWTPPERAGRGAMEHPLGGPSGRAGLVRLEVLELPTPAMPATIAGLARAVGLRFRPSLSGGGARDANLGRQIVRLAPIRGGSLSPIVRLASPAGDDRSVELLGCRWLVRRAG